MPQLTRALVWCIFAVHLQAGGGLHKIWEVTNPSGLAASSREPVWGLSFSPDETKLAIGIGEIRKPEGHGYRSHVVVIPIDHPETILHRFEIGDIYAPGGNEPNIPLAWSPSGNLLAVGTSPSPTVLGLAASAPCRVPPKFLFFAGFLADDHAAFFSGSESIVLRPDCTPVDRWRISGHVRDTCPELRLLILQSHEGNGKPHFSVLKYPEKETVQQWIEPGSTFAMRFANSCTAVCGDIHPAGGVKNHLACRDIQSGSMIAEDLNLSQYSSKMSVGGKLIAATDYKITIRAGRFWTALDADGITARVKRRVIWDVRTGKEVASWMPDRQKVQIPVGELSTTFSYTLSPTGKYLAEGGSGSVKLYSIVE